jgi:hypothetical protein
MSDERDQRIAAILRAESPAARDPLLRIKVMARREQRQLQRQSLTMLAGALVIMLIAMFSIRGAGGVTVQVTGAFVIGAALPTSYLAFRGRLLRIVRRFGGYWIGAS